MTEFKIRIIVNLNKKEQCLFLGPQYGICGYTGACRSAIFRFVLVNLWAQFLSKAKTCARCYLLPCSWTKEPRFSGYYLPRKSLPLKRKSIKSHFGKNQILGWCPWPCVCKCVQGHTMTSHFFPKDNVKHEPTNCHEAVYWHWWRGTRARAC